MFSHNDLLSIAHQPLVKIWGEDLDQFPEIPFYKGKFVVSEEGQFFAKLFPLEMWDNIEFFMMNWWLNLAFPIQKVSM
ncbi:hypothetical protein IPJ72_01330 [Candidatus Peregrinibacteria bacterium]|nr:MAG: hypothetical protein IPJ72_01330 [Candidatus Peregrinibacteria bacterium]